MQPGTAQPYYPGDPVPAMQGAAPVAQPSMVAAAPQMAPTTAPVVSQPTTQFTQPVVQQAPAQFTQPAFTQPAYTQSPNIQPSYAQPVANPVQQASYDANLNQVASPAFGQTAVGANGAPLADSGFTNPALPADADPRAAQAGFTTSTSTEGFLDSSVSSAAWRSPGMSDPATNPATYTQPTSMPSNVQPVSGVQIVPQETTPRIRMPSPVGGQASYNGFPVQPAAYATPVAAPQTVAVTALPSQQQPVIMAPQMAQPPAPAMSGWQAPTTAPTIQAAPYSDGFRPRNSLR